MWLLNALHNDRARAGQAGGTSSGWKPRRGGAHTRVSSRESVFYDDDAEIRAAPMPSGDKCAFDIPWCFRALCSSSARLCMDVR